MLERRFKVAGISSRVCVRRNVEGYRASEGGFSSDLLRLTIAPTLGEGHA